MRTLARSAAALAFLVPGILLAQKVETGFLNRTAVVGGQSYRYQVYVPFDYSPGTAWPVILFLHGAGERGSDGLLQTNVGLGAAIRRDPTRYPAIAVFPQVPRDSMWAGAPADAGLLALKQTMAEYHVDPDRVYLTGLSMGWHGTWYLAYRNSDLFAAIVPICGWVPEFPQFRGSVPVVPPDSGPPLPAMARRLKSLPVWIFHREMDPVVPASGSQDAFAALKDAGGNVRFTQHMGLDHNSWDATYGSKEFTDWLFAQHRTRK